MDKPTYSDYTDEMALAAIPDMDAAIAKLNTYAANVTIATLYSDDNSGIPVGAVHAFAELAENYPGANLTSDSAGMAIKRRKTPEMLRDAVISEWRSTRYYADLAEWEKGETARKANANVEGL